jgi:hypothetical protein
MIIFSIALLFLVNQVYSKAFLNQNSNFFNNPSDNQLKLMKKIFSQKSNEDYRYQGSETEENAPIDDYSVDNVNEQINELKRKYDSSYETSINLKKSNKFLGKNKRSFQIQTYYDAVVQKDGTILLIPKDVNKNHYFIG